MLPSVVANELEQVAKDAIRTSFHPTTPGFTGLIERFLAKRDQLFKGPYVSISLPFRQGSERNWFPQIPLSFSPYLHQEKAFHRLQPGSPKNTLVATGTGSGKTECFLLPILEHCRQQQAQGQRGVKAILIYPMNALATDQARRIAKQILTTPSLAGLRAGLYIGESDEIPISAMTADSVITDRESLHKAPPDILLTNYKQLDYLLVQPHVQNLWKYNQVGTLRYLVVDEFHTFDGAQGTDLACLIRRLRDRLHCPLDEVVCVGTSATLGGPDSKESMLSYAGQVFASHFDTASLIEEERLTVDEFFSDCTAFGDSDNGGLFALPLPGVADIEKLNPSLAENTERYIAKLVDLWLAKTMPSPPGGDVNAPSWRVELGKRLGTLPSVHNLVRQANVTCSMDELLARFSKQLGLGERYPLTYRLLLLESLLALISHARRTVPLIGGNEILVPWVNLRQQIWLRELKRMVASVAIEPQLRFSDDLGASEFTPHLPVVHCRDCGATGWASTVVNQDSNQLDRAHNLQSFYRAFFSNDSYLRYVFPSSSKISLAKKLCCNCLSFYLSKDVDNAICPSCQSRSLIDVDIPDCSRNDDHQ